MNPAADDLLGSVPLYLTDAEERAIVDASARVAVGSVRLHRWQVHPVRPVPADFAGHEAYLVKVNYALAFEPDQRPSWVEVGFEFVSSSYEDSGAMVAAALPRTVSRPEPAQAFELGPDLGFAPHDGRQSGRWPANAAASLIALPALAPRIDCDGIGGAEVRWRHTGTATDLVPVGSQTAWIVLVVPEGCRLVQVIASASYDLAGPAPAGLRLAMRAEPFVVDLPSAPGVMAQPSDTSYARSVGSPRIFVSYAHESASHKHAVRELCAFLRSRGMDVRVDQDGLEERLEWNKWTNQQMLNADYILVVASPAMRAADVGELPPDWHRGVVSELARLVDLLHRDRPKWFAKILPVILPGRSLDDVPLSFLPYIGTHYFVSSFTLQGAADLLRVLERGRQG